MFGGGSVGRSKIERRREPPRARLTHAYPPNDFRGVLRAAKHVSIVLVEEVLHIDLHAQALEPRQRRTGELIAEHRMRVPVRRAVLQRAVGVAPNRQLAEMTIAAPDTESPEQAFGERITGEQVGLVFAVSRQRETYETKLLSVVILEVREYLRNRP